MKNKIFCVVIISAMILLFGGSWLSFRKDRKKEEGLKRYTSTFLDVFDTKTEIVAYAYNEEEFQENAELMKKELEEYHRLFDIYKDYEGVNNMKTINDNAGIQPVQVDEKIIDLLLFSKDIYGRTEGQVNIAMGSILNIWHEYRTEGRNNPENARLPEMDKLQEATLHTDIHKIIIDPEKNTVYLEDPAMSLDVGGIGKGYAVQKVADFANSLGMDGGLISVGGNVCSFGPKADGTAWKIGIQNPDLESEEEYIHKVNVTKGSVVTSGDYQRYYMVDDVKYCHIIDPDTLMPADYFAAVTVLTKDSGIADAMSTALYNMPFEEGMDFVTEINDLEAMWVLKDGTIHFSPGFETYFDE